MAKVLIVDDDPFVREGLVAVLESEGHTVSESTSANEGRAFLTDHGADTDLVLLDLWLPEESGLNILRDTRVERPDLPVVVMSGGGPGRSLEQAIAIADAAGASSVIIKPFRNEELMDAINGALSEI